LTKYRFIFQKFYGQPKAKQKQWLAWVGDFVLTPEKKLKYYFFNFTEEIIPDHDDSGFSSSSSYIIKLKIVHNP
jgi:hypothetical protein